MRIILLVYNKVCLISEGLLTRVTGNDKFSPLSCYSTATYAFYSVITRLLLSVDTGALSQP